MFLLKKSKLSSEYLITGLCSCFIYHWCSNLYVDIQVGLYDEIKGNCECSSYKKGDYGSIIVTSRVYYFTVGCNETNYSRVVYHACSLKM